MYKKLKKKVTEINDKLEVAEYVSTELIGIYYELEKELEMSFGNEKEKIEKLLKIKADNELL